MSSSERYHELKIIVLATFMAFLLVALASYSPQDPAWSHAYQVTYIHNLEGQFGAYCADIFLTSLGLCGFSIPLFIGLALYQKIKRLKFKHPSITLLGIFISTFSFSGLVSLYGPNWTVYPEGAGGWLGQTLAWAMLSAFNPFGATLILIAFMLGGLTLIFDTGIAPTVKQFWMYLCKPNAYIGSYLTRRFSSVLEKPIQSTETAPPSIEKQTCKTAHSKTSYLFPSTRLLTFKKSLPKSTLSADKLKLLSANIEQKLLSYGVSATVEAVHPGPVITQLELRLASGIKASKITSLSNDLARLLSVSRVRVVEIIPGKSTVGLELPNTQREMVYLREILESETYRSAPSPLTLALGKDIAGRPIVTDLAKMPHLLVAGTTGSGKSVGLNTMILSLLYKASPDEVKLILIDPKMLELSVYQDIPHLLTPVVTDVQEATGVLKWCVQEMERRYKLIALLGVRNIASFNDKLDQMAAQGRPMMHPNSEDEAPEPLERLPHIIVVADEFADMMMVVGKSVEQLIARIAQKARAAGIHLILATQRPSVDVITGLIKANIPTRIAFQVSSKIDSRTILDQQGAEQLLGAGDMLYLPVGASTPTRIHGVFISDDEVHRVVKAIKCKTPNTYDESIQHSVDQSSHQTSNLQDPRANSEASPQDPLYEQAVEIIARTRRASISSLQRRLRIGYNRAATLIEGMEEAGLIGPMKSSAGQREILIPNPESSSDERT